MNPALGVRGVRLGLREPELLLTHLRALLEACAGRTLDVMLPMVSSLDELADARAALSAAATASRTAGAPIASDVRLGIMVEVPAVAVLADKFAPVVDFLSIGTNDLTQYTRADDDAALAELASPLQPAVLRLVSGVVDAARRTGRPVTVCGEAAADPVAGPILAGLGVDILSVAPTAVLGVAARLAAVERETAERVGRASLSAGSLADVRRLGRELDGSAGAERLLRRGCRTPRAGRWDRGPGSASGRRTARRRRACRRTLARLGDLFGRPEQHPVASDVAVGIGGRRRRATTLRATRLGHVVVLPDHVAGGVADALPGVPPRHANAIRCTPIVIAAGSRPAATASSRIHDARWRRASGEALLPR